MVRRRARTPRSPAAPTSSPGGAVDRIGSGSGIDERCRRLSTIARRAGCSGSTRAASATSSRRSRECFEEAGLLFAADAERAGVVRRCGRPASVSRDTGASLNAGATTLAAICRCGDTAARGRPTSLLQPLDHAGRVHLGASTPVSSWPSRRRTRTRCTTTPRSWQASGWCRPRPSSGIGAGELHLMFPTVKHLETLSGFSSAAGFLGRGRRPRSRPSNPGSRVDGWRRPDPAAGRARASTRRRVCRRAWPSRTVRSGPAGG